jgi:UPF0755 protein
MPEEKMINQATSPAALEKARSPWLLYGVWLLFLAALLLLLYGLYLFGPTGKMAEVRIPRGSGAAAVGRILEQAKVVRSGPVLAYFLRLSGQDKNLRPGLYRLEGRGVRAVVTALTEARPITVTLTFPEGWRAAQIAERLTQNNLDGQGFLALVQSPPADLRPKYAKGPTLEGFLFPATYEFGLDATAEELVRTLTQRMQQEITPFAQSQLAKLKLSVQDWVTLASVVQSEAANAAEKPKIAGIFLNRLNIGMPLQADPTVAYGLGKTLPELNRGAGDFESNTPYNTYKVRGLPPTAIGNPGADALRSVLNPVRSAPNGKPYLYFLHAQGRLFLNTEFSAHLRDTEKYYR